jgi:hypothetical protein
VAIFTIVVIFSKIFDDAMINIGPLVSLIMRMLLIHDSYIHSYKKKFL